MSDAAHPPAWAKGRLDAVLRNLDGLGEEERVTSLADAEEYARAAGTAESALDRVSRRVAMARRGVREAQQVLDALDDADTRHVTATESFVWNCRDCGFVGEWLTVDGRCPECGGRDLPTEER